MNSRSAWFWSFTAAVILLALVAYERLFHRPPPGPEYLLPGFDPAVVESVQVIAPKMEEIRVRRTNGTWQMTGPLVYPAQANSIEALLQALSQEVPATKISGAQLRNTEGERAAYGLETPRASVVLAAGGGRQQVLIGSVTSPGDQVFVQVVGREGIYVIDAGLLKLIPDSANVWRDTGFCSLSPDSFNDIQVVSPDGTVELKRETTNRTWRIVRPMQARADDAHLENLVQALRNLRVQQFVSDNPQADREAWGLQPPQIQIVFSKDTNLVQTLQIGASVEGDSRFVYAVGREPETVVTVAADPLRAWSATPTDFRDRQLIKLPGGVASIEIGDGTSFTIENTTNNTWQIEPQGYPAETATVQRFIDGLQNLRAVQFVKDVVAEPDLPEYGLATPHFKVRFTLRAGPGGKAAPPIGLDFGSVKDGLVYVKRTDENAVYGVDAKLLETLPAAAGHFRKLALWNFTEADVESITLQKGEARWQVRRNGENQWSLAPGSQGIVNAFAIEETVHQLGQLSAVVWTDWGEQDYARYGLDPDSLTLTVALKNGGQREVRFGFPAPSSHVYAGTVLNGETWVFEFPSETYNLLETYLTKPSNLR